MLESLKIIILILIGIFQVTLSDLRYLFIYIYYYFDLNR